MGITEFSYTFTNRWSNCNLHYIESNLSECQVFNGYVFSAFFNYNFSISYFTFGHENLFIAIYGARIMLLHFPLIL
jgi:hypothetical protein